MTDIHFNQPFLTGKETDYIRQAVESGKISGNGLFTQRCQQFLERRYGFRKVLLTTSCTDALEMAAILADVGPGDDVMKVTRCPAATTSWYQRSRPLAQATT